jgi:hypothetical protein
MLWFLLAAFALACAFCSGWVTSEWLCSKKLRCPLRTEKSEREWKKEVAAENKARRDANPELIDNEITKPITPKRKP